MFAFNTAFRSNFIVCALLFLAACGGGSSNSGGGQEPAPTPPAPPPTQSRSVAVIGDSIGNGFGLVAAPWPVLLADILGDPVNNTSVSDQQTSWGVGIIGERLDAVNPTHVVIMLGTNDALRASAPVAIANLQTMVDIARGRGVIPIVVTLPPVIGRSDFPGANQRSAQISSGIRGLSGARIADVRPSFGNSGALLADGIHPNQTGQQVIADIVAQAFN